MTNWRHIFSWRQIPPNPQKAEILYGIYCAEAVLHIFENEYPNDNRCRRAIELAKIALKSGSEEDRARAIDASVVAINITGGGGSARDAADAVACAKRAARKANESIDFDSLKVKAKNDIWEYM